MIRTEIDITNPQKVEVIETGEIGYVTLYDGEDDNSPFLVCRKNGEEIHWFNPEELRPIEVIATPKEKSLEDEVKEILVSENGFTKDYLLNNRGLIGATIDIVKQLKK